MPGRWLGHTEKDRFVDACVDLNVKNICTCALTGLRRCDMCEPAISSTRPNIYAGNRTNDKCVRQFPVADVSKWNLC